MTRAKQKKQLSEQEALLAMLQSIQKPDTFWPRVAKEVKEGKLNYGFGKSAIPGLATIEAMHVDCFAPLGTVWFRFISENQIDVVYSYVRPGVRRCGVRTYLHNKLLQTYPHARITTNSGTMDGMQWMAKIGFRFNPPGEWVFDRNAVVTDNKQPEQQVKKGRRHGRRR